MIDWLRTLLVHPGFGWVDLIDIGIAALVIYELLKLIRGTRAVQMGIGVGVLEAGEAGAVPPEEPLVPGADPGDAAAILSTAPSGASLPRSTAIPASAMSGSARGRTTASSQVAAPSRWLTSGAPVTVMALGSSRSRT